MNGDSNAYTPGLSMDELVARVRALLAQQRIAERLVCRYLADLADLIKSRSFGHGWSDIYHAARALFGLSTRATRERVRIGKALRELPVVEEAFLGGEVRYSQVREVTRVAKPETQAEWVKLAKELDIRTLERRVNEASGGAVAKDKTQEPAAMSWTSPETVEVRLHVRAETWALLQRAMEGARRLADDDGLLGQDDALAAVARDALAHQATSESADVHRTVVLYECHTCQRVELETGAGGIELDDATAATLGCGARVRDLRTEGCVVTRGGEIPSAVERAVKLRDRMRCRVPGCNLRRHVAVHHIEEQAKGGEHSRRNCVCLCTKHHGWLHRGELFITGNADRELRFTDGEGRPIVDGRRGATHGGSSGEPIVGPAMRLLATMGKRGGWWVDHLCEATDLSVDAVLDGLLTLQLAGKVREGPPPGAFQAVDAALSA